MVPIAQAPIVTSVDSQDGHSVVLDAMTRSFHSSVPSILLSCKFHGNLSVVSGASPNAAWLPRDLDVLVGRHSGLVLSGLSHDERGSVGNPASEHLVPQLAPTVLMDFAPRHQLDPGHFVVPASAHRGVVLRARNDVDGLALNHSSHELVRVLSLLPSMSINKRRECRLNSLVVL
ncbi:hypothetical protein [Pandoraea terrigena]|uniref:hypothetical protein n=1 Tax=Pandoraea terrigena TaxID=2508292 RepID=UPI0012416AFD|nr:hypothetical protein [Pandoraea terrigena]